MSGSNLLLGLLPLIVFVILDTFLSVKKALLFALLLAMVEAIYTIYTFGELDLVTGLSFLLLAVLGGTSFYKEDSIYFKFQPVILSLFLSIYLLFTYYFGVPLFVEMVEKYGGILPENQRVILNLPEMQVLLKNISLTSGFGFFVHGIITGYAAKKLSNIWWLICRGIGFYIIFFISFLVARFLM
jgi:intracellular septation protein A